MAISAQGIAASRGGFRLAVDAFGADATGTAVVGRNGAGKTTLLLALQDLIAHDGRVQRPARCAGVFAQPALLRGSVLGNIEAVGAANGRARRALELVDLATFAARDVRQLSSGERQRLSLARALALEPEALFLDEAFANVDADGRGPLRAVVRAYVERTGCALVVATQTLADARALCRDVVVLEEGRVVQAAVLDAALQAPTPYLAALAAEAQI